MRYLRTITDSDVFNYPKIETPSRFESRPTVKAIVVNEGRFGFVTNPIHGFLLLPGGGAESNNLRKEIKRECIEEMSCEVEVLGKVGRVLEYRNRDSRKYRTVCFAVKVTGEARGQKSTDEKRNDLYVVWLKKNEAVDILQDQVSQVMQGEVEFYNTAFNIIRDNLFFTTYLKKMFGAQRNRRGLLAKIGNAHRPVGRDKQVEVEHV